MTIQSNRKDNPPTAKRPEWLPIVAQAAERQSCRGLPTPPPGLPFRSDRGRNGYYTTTPYERKDGSVRIHVKWCLPGYQTTVVGSYVIIGSGVVPVGKIIQRGDGLLVRIMQDALGLPWPMLVIDGAPTVSATA